MTLVANINDIILLIVFSHTVLYFSYRRSARIQNLIQTPSAILNCAGGALLQAVSKYPWRRKAGIKKTEHFLSYKINFKKMYNQKS